MCIRDSFVPALIDREDIRAIASAARLPLNVMVRPGIAPSAELCALGIRRLSAGAAIAQVVWGRTAALAGAFLKEGRSEPLCDGASIYPEINALFNALS